MATNYHNNYLLKSKSTRQSSITTAKSNAVLAREKHEKTIKEFESKRDAFGTAVTPVDPTRSKSMRTPIAQKYTDQKDSFENTHTAEKSRPKVYPSSHFKDVGDIPVSIFGTTLTKSKQVQETYETTQSQQKELHHKITKAASWNEAVKLRKTAMDENPLVGTANTIFEKGKAVGSSGVLIEKKPRIKEGIDVYSVTINGKTRSFKNKSNADEFLNRYESTKYPTIPGQYYTVSTPDGAQTRKFESFSDARMYQQKVNDTLDVKADIYQESNVSHVASPDEQLHGPPAPKNDDLISVDAENQKLQKEIPRDESWFTPFPSAYADSEPINKNDTIPINSNEIPISENPIFVDAKNQRRAEEIRIAGGTYGDYLQTLDKNTLDYQLKEVGLGAKRAYNSYTGLLGYTLIDPKTHGRSLLDSAFDDTIKYIENPNDPKPYDTTINAIHERSPAQHAGDIITTGAIEAGLFLVTGGVANLAVKGASKLPYLLKTKPQSVVEHLKHPKKDLGYTKAQELAERIYSNPKDLRLAEKLENDVIFRRKSEKLARAIKKSNRETPVGVEKISNDSYLISAGTENKTPLPMVLYRTGKNKKSTVFSPVDPDGIITPKNILIKGNSKKEFSETAKLSENVSVAPGNAKNLEKIADPKINDFIKPESVITDIPNSFLEKYPKVAVHGAAQSNIPSSIYVTTEQRNPLKGFNADVTKLDAPDSLSKTDPSKFKETVLDIVKTESEIKPTGKGGLNRNIVGRESKSSATSKSSSGKSGEILPKSSTKTKSVKIQGDVAIVEKIVNNSKIKDVSIFNPIVEKSSSQRTTTDITLDVKPEQAHDPFLDEMVKHQQKTDVLTGTKQKLNQPDTEQKAIPDDILFDLLIKPGMQGTRQDQDLGIGFVAHSTVPPDDILTPTRSRPVPIGSDVLRHRATSKTGRGVMTRRERREFLGNTRQDSILGVYDRTEIIHGDKKVRRTERKDAKIVRGLRRRADREILPSVKSKDSNFLDGEKSERGKKSKDEDIDFLGGRKSETNTPKRGKPQKEILPSVKSKDNSFLDGEKSEKGKKSKDEDIDFLGGTKSEKGKKSKFDGWF